MTLVKNDKTLGENKNIDSKNLVRNFLLNYQNKLTKQLSILDGKKNFIEDTWQRDHLGHGITRVISNGDYFEQGGVNFSEIHGENPPPSLLGRMPELENHSFWGAGVSLVLHPINPFCPTVHLNYRYFEAGPVWWFGGGCDLTPYYPFKEDCIHWHQTIKATMDKHDKNYYPAFKYWCDEYFYNHHRKESRGIGGSFYDHLNGNAGVIIKDDYARKSETNHPALHLTTHTKTWDDIFALQQDNANCFLDAYTPIANKRRSIKYNHAQRQFQLYRRGRYVEFNLLHDRGTTFGIQSNGRTESILMSLPPLVRWEYNFKAEPGSPEEDLTKNYLHRHIDWTHQDK
jgi:coproporphyrinogen III oxidase